MEQTIRRLRVEIGFVFLWAAVLVGLFEWDVLDAGYYSGDGRAEYFMNLVGILMIFIFVPFSLKLMSFNRVKASFNVGDANKVCRAYCRWSEIRMALLAVTMWSNICFYYLTQDNTGFLCALIVLLGLCFCFPSADKLTYETGLKIQDGNTLEKQDEK